MYQFLIFHGAKNTMESYANKGVSGLNTKTMRYQIIDKAAKYEVRLTETEEPQSELYSLFSDIDLIGIAKYKGLII